MVLTCQLAPSCRHWSMSLELTLPHDPEIAGYTICGMGTGEGPEERAAALQKCAEALPAAKPKLLVGLTQPLDILEAAALGIDIFGTDLASQATLQVCSLCWRRSVARC